MQAVSGTGEVNVYNNGTLNVGNGGGSYDTGIVAYTGGFAIVTNNGSITTYANVHNTFGIYDEAKGGAVVFNTGDISVTSPGLSVGIGDLGATNASAYVNNTGDIYAHATGPGAALGIYQGATGQVTIYNSGNVTAIGGAAYGIDAYSTGGNVVIRQSGDVAVASSTGEAAGLYAKGLGVFVSDTGTTTVTSSHGYATGIQVISTTGGYDSTLRVYGGVSATGYTGATGIDVSGSGASTIVFGSVSARAYDGVAQGVRSTTGDENNTVYVSGNVAASGLTGATGVFATSDAYVGVSVGGNVSASSYSGAATGVYAVSVTGSTNVHIGGNVYAASDKDTASGVFETSATGGIVSIGGNVRVLGYAKAYGVYVRTGGDSHGQHRRQRHGQLGGQLRLRRPRQRGRQFHRVDRRRCVGLRRHGRHGRVFVRHDLFGQHRRQRYRRCPARAAARPTASTRSVPTAQRSASAATSARPRASTKHTASMPIPPAAR